MAVTVASMLKKPKLKVQRANRHIDELRQRTSPLDRSLYEIVCSQTYRTVLDRYPSGHQLVYRPKDDIPETFAGIIGDAIGNVRSAFDYVAGTIIDEWGVRPKGPLYFPITKWENLISQVGFSAINQSLPGFAERFIKEIRPENGPNEHLWDFHALNKDDKHNDFIPVVSVVKISNLNADTGRFVIRDHTDGFNAARPHALITSSHNPITVQNNFQASVQVLFGKGTPFENEPVIPTLSQVTQLASETLDWLGRLAAELKGIPP